eukprot:3914705-Pleurochrysis_carterae.AAC.2
MFAVLFELRPPIPNQMHSCRQQHLCVKLFRRHFYIYDDGSRDELSQSLAPYVRDRRVTLHRVAELEPLPESIAVDPQRSARTTRLAIALLCCTPPAERAASRSVQQGQRELARTECRPHQLQHRCLVACHLPCPFEGSMRGVRAASRTRGSTPALPPSPARRGRAKGHMQDAAACACAGVRTRRTRRAQCLSSGSPTADAFAPSSLRSRRAGTPLPHAPPPVTTHVDKGAPRRSARGWKQR